ncbi:MAG: isocitrate/isopropylmalate family dehydrogenase, partial [Dongiaceae bacterium]
LCNPLATLLSFAMCLRHSFDLAEDAGLVEGAVEDVLAAGYRTADIMGPGLAQVSTTAMGDQILKALDRRAA